MDWQPRQLTRAQQEERRRAGAGLLRAGKHMDAEIARCLGVSRAAVSQWRTVLTEHGLRGLRAKRASGRTADLTQTQRRELVQILKRGARRAGYRAGYRTERWTQRRIARVIERQFGVVYNVTYIGRLMKRLGWSVQQPESRASERDEALIRAWLSYDWARIKKSAAQRRRDRVR